MSNMPSWLKNWVAVEENEQLKAEFIEQSADCTLVNVSWNGENQEVTEAEIHFSLTNEDIQCTYKPHLTPNDDMVVGDLFFQSPAMVFEHEDKMMALIPDIDFLEENREAPHYMDYVKPEQKIYYGIGHYKKVEHVYHVRDPKSFAVEKDQLLFRFYLVEWRGVSTSRDFQPVSQFLWKQFAQKRMLQTETSLEELKPYADYTYDWAFNRWEPVVWQEFELDGEEVGGAVFIVRAGQKPGRGKENSWREKKSLWNQAWFSSLRSAYGYALWGKEQSNAEWIQKADLAKNFALSAPQQNGLFPSVYEADEQNQWENGRWVHSNRTPENYEEFGHLLDMSWTCYWMLKWYMDIEQDEKLLDYAVRYAERLLELQQEKGNFPAWIHMETNEFSPYLMDSPETSMHAWFLAKLYTLTKQSDYLRASERAIQFVMEEVIPEGRWEDFETYWSCSRIWEGKQYGKKEPRSGLYHQCSFSIYWTAEALKELYRVTEKEMYLETGEQVLAELSLYQAIWEPPFINVPVLGGFGVMNTDDEWNDARQSLFALTYHDYYELTGKEEYRCRSEWAMRASFYMMYCPENPEVSALYEQTFPFFDERDYGFEMENAHHGQNIDHAGEFTIFDWGNGSASSSLAELLFVKKA